MLALAAPSAATLKYDGVFTLQTKGDGPIRLMVADVTSGGDVRGYAQFDAERLAPPGRRRRSVVPRLLGAGYLAFTVDQGSHTERYQGIVELIGATLVDCMHHYFRQSEQFDAAIRVAVGAPRRAGEAWRASALMLQRLPPGAQRPPTRSKRAGAAPWRLMASGRNAEMLDPDLGAERSALSPVPRGWRAGLHAVAAAGRLPLLAGARGAGPPLAAGRRRWRSLKVDGRLTVTCEFCNSGYEFTEQDLAALRRPDA